MRRYRKPVSLLPPSKRRRSAVSPQTSPDLLALWHVVSTVPYGCATTYGEVARAAGLPGRARLAGRALRNLPDEMHLPWHRIVRAGGRIAFARTSAQFRRQARLLRSEGVSVENGRVDARALITAEDIPA